MSNSDSGVAVSRLSRGRPRSRSSASMSGQGAKTRSAASSARPFTTP